MFYVWFDAPIGYISITANYTADWKVWVCATPVLLVAVRFAHLSCLKPTVKPRSCRPHVVCSLCEQSRILTQRCMPCASDEQCCTMHATLLHMGRVSSHDN